MKSGSFGFLVLSLVIILFFAGCEKAAAPPVLKGIGPTKAKAGEAFNVQPDGGAAMWANAQNATQTTVIVWGDTRLASHFKNSEFLTAGVPKDLYAKPGQFQIYLLDTKTGAKSNSLPLVVE